MSIMVIMVISHRVEDLVKEDVVLVKVRGMHCMQPHDRLVVASRDGLSLCG